MRNTSVVITMEKLSASHVVADGQAVWQSGFSSSPAVMGSTHSLGQSLPTVRTWRWFRKEGCFAPQVRDNGTFAFASPVDDGYVSMIALDDLAFTLTASLKIQLRVKASISKCPSTTCIGMTRQKLSRQSEVPKLSISGSPNSSTLDFTFHIQGSYLKSNFNPNFKIAPENPQVVAWMQNFGPFGKTS